jgi:hypothetical protein
MTSDEELWGTYRLISSTKRFVDTGEELNTVGAHPKGYITYGREGRMLGLITYDGRVKPDDPAAIPDVQRIELFNTMTAYGGTYTYSGDKIEHHVDISWNEAWNGTTVIRDVIHEQNRLIYVTAPYPERVGPTSGKMVVSTLVWEKVVA